MRDHYKEIVEYTENYLQWIIRYQNMDEMSPAYGAFIHPEEGYEEPGKWGSGICLNILVSLYYNQDSKYGNNNDLLIRSIAATKHILKNQNEDGTVNQKTSNFHCTPAAAFTINTLIPAYEIILRYGKKTDEEVVLETLLRTFINRAGKALLNGGFHTPNHRWVISSALAKLYTLSQEEAYLIMAKRYLQEGIDINEDGGYTEKSVGGYDAVVDEALLQIALSLEKPELLSYIEQNLKMLISYFQPDGSIFTGQSHRQDRGNKVFPEKYYGIYLQASYFMKNPIFAYIADDIFKSHLKRSLQYGPERNDLPIYMLQEELKEYEPECISYEKNYEHWMKETGLVRIRRGDYVITLLEDNPNFFHLDTQNLSMVMRLNASFFARGQFIAQSLEAIKDGYRLKFSVEYGYIKPFKEKPSTSKWEKMEHGDWADIKRFNTVGLYPMWDEIDHGNRDTCNVQNLKFQIDVQEKNEGISVQIQSEGQETVLCVLECIFGAGGVLENDAFAIRGEKGTNIIVKKGICRYIKGIEEINIGPGFGKHLETKTRGAFEKGNNGVTVFYTDETPMKRKVNIKIKGVNGGKL